MILIRNKDFEVVSRSRNLRGILSYSRHTAVERIDLYKAPDGCGQFGITWCDGASCITDFASYNVMADFAKKRTFKAAPVFEH